MKRIIAMLLIAVLVLCGCQEAPMDTTPVTEPPTETIPPEPETTVPDVEGDLGIMDPDEDLEALGLRRYPLTGDEHYAVRSMGKGILLLSGTEETTLTFLQDGMEPLVVTLTDITLSEDDVSWAIGKSGIIYYDDIYNEMVELDLQLQETRRLPMPVDMDCEPAFTSDMQRAYYFDRKGKLRVLDLQTGISRFLTDEKPGDPQIMATHFGDQVLECLVGESEYLMIDGQNGAVLFSSAEALELTTSGDWYFVPWDEGYATDLIFGERGGTRSCFLREFGDSDIPLADRRAVACISQVEDGCQVQVYSLDQEPCVSVVAVPGCVVKDMAVDDRLDWVWILDEPRDGAQILYGWDPSVTAEETEDAYVGPYHTADAPDTDGLERIAQEAKDLGDRYGLKILVYEAALGIQPSDYVFSEEYIVSVYDHYLKLLEEQLQIYPASMLKKLGKSSGNGRLTVSLVRSISGTGDMGGISATDGIQYWKGGNAYLALAMGERFAQTFHHELFHTIDTYVLAETKAYDFWDSMNPKGFSYDRDYVKNAFRDPEQYVTGEDRAFVDTYSMSFPKEDRARIMEYAVQEGQAEVFASATMQKKLRTVCRGIRSAFGMSSSSEAFLWEQYLETPLN